MTHSHWTDDRRQRFADVRLIGQGPIQGLSNDPTTITHGKNSGHQAVSLAVAFGAARIVLLGYDMEVTRGQPEHFYDRHGAGPASKYLGFRTHFETLISPLRARGIEIVNCSRETALTCVPRGTVTDVLSAVAA